METLFLVPGLLCDAAIWAHQVATLSDRYDVRVPNLTGCNSIDAMVDEILDGAPSAFSIAGHSMGGRVAMRLVERTPERVHRLALLDTGVHCARLGEAESRQALLDVSASQGMRALADIWLPPMVREGALKNSTLRASLYAMVERMSPEIHRRQIAALLGRPDARPSLDAIDCPVLVGVGGEDRWSPPEQHRLIATAIPGADLVVFADSGHMAPIEAPEAVTASLMRWMLRPTICERTNHG